MFCGIGVSFLFILQEALDNGIIYIERDHIKKNLRENEYDVVIVGGGITGAGIALDASNRGMKVALVEMQDFAQGTSSRSTKLVRWIKIFETITSWRCS